jgi:hypothetical protein
MPLLVNRDKDQSEQRDVYQVQCGNIATGATVPLMSAPNPCQIVSVQESAVGISGAPVHTLFVCRFVVGTGTTTIALSATLSPTAFGTSGLVGWSTASFGVTTPAQGNTTAVQLLQGDQLFLVSTGANTSAYQPVVTIVTKALQDIKTHFGL